MSKDRDRRLALMMINDEKAWEKAGFIQIEQRLGAEDET